MKWYRMAIWLLKFKCETDIINRKTDFKKKKNPKISIASTGLCNYFKRGHYFTSLIKENSCEQKSSCPPYILVYETILQRDVNNQQIVDLNLTFCVSAAGLTVARIKLQRQNSYPVSHACSLQISWHGSKIFF